MSLAPGTRLGPYEIQSPLGAGGMGEVYKARDTRLDRSVAVKVLPSSTIPSADVRQRFEREAKAISQLSHPHICTLFDVGQANGTDFLVMELLEGETLQERLGRGPLPLDQVARFGAEIGDALDRAHRRGIAHRDLKPGNVMLTKSGVKLLDFGLARTIAPAFPGGSEVKTATAPAGVTAEGTILGTLHYMAPEQLEGKTADARTDVFALGLVLYEMAAGQRAFGGTSAAAVAAEILRAEPVPLATLRAECPPALELVVHGCLAKDPDQRWQSAHDVKLQLDAFPQVGTTASARDAAPRRWALLPWAAAALVAAIAGAALLRTQSPPTARPVRFSLPPPEGHRFGGWTEATTFALSPDGGTLAFIAINATGRRLFLRSLSSLEAKLLEGTEGAVSAFWSPDGQSLGFFAAGKLKRLDLGSGAPVPICSVRAGAGISGTWGADGQMLFASIEGDAIFRVSTSGGEVVKEREREPGAGVQRVSWPSFLPDGRRYLYVARHDDRSYHVMIAERDRPAREVRASDSYAHAVPPGYLVFAREGTLLAQQFDLATGQVAGEPSAVAEPVLSFGSVGWASFSVSRSGVLAFASPGDRVRLTWFDRGGRGQPLEATASVATSAGGQGLRFSRDGRRALFNRANPRTGNLDIWSLDLVRGVESPLTSDPDTEVYGLLLPDGSLVYSEPRGPSPRLFRRDLATGETRAFAPESSFQVAQDVTPDGQTVVFAGRAANGAFDLLAIAVAGGPVTTLLGTPFDEKDLRLSPDGRFAAFVSDEPGQNEVYVAPFPRLGEKTRVSQEGAGLPRWSHDGRELFYLTADRRLVAVPVRAGASLELGQPRTLFALQGRHTWSSYDVAPDGRFLALVPESLASEQPLTIVVNWPSELRRGTVR